MTILIVKFVRLCIVGWWRL